MAREFTAAAEDAADVVFGRSKEANAEALDRRRREVNPEGGVGTAPYGPELPPGYARGTSFYPGGWGIVGEQGPELLRLPRGSEILPAAMTERAMGNSVVFEAGAIVVNAPGGDPRQVEIGVLRALRAGGVMP
jgi:hypothetical protein